MRGSFRMESAICGASGAAAAEETGGFRAGPKSHAHLPPPAAPPPRWVGAGPASARPGLPPLPPRPRATTARGRLRAALEEEIFGKHVLITSHDDWPVPEVIAAYRSQSEAESAFRQMKDPRVASFSPMFHWTEHNIRVHAFTCVLALQVAHLMRRQARQAGLHLSLRELLGQLAGIEETVLIYPSAGGRPTALRMLTETTPEQDQLAAVFELGRWSPRPYVIGS